MSTKNGKASRHHGGAQGPAANAAAHCTNHYTRSVMQLEGVLEERMQQVCACIMCRIWARMGLNGVLCAHGRRQTSNCIDSATPAFLPPACWLNVYSALPSFLLPIASTHTHTHKHIHSSTCWWRRTLPSSGVRRPCSRQWAAWRAASLRPPRQCWCRQRQRQQQTRCSPPCDRGGTKPSCAGCSSERQQCRCV